MDKVTCLVDEEKGVGVTYLDFNETFYTVSNIILPEKLATYGLGTCALCYVKIG